MTVLLIGVTCVAMNLLLCSSGVYYMDKIADALQGSGTVILNEGEAASFDPQLDVYKRQPQDRSVRVSPR